MTATKEFRVERHGLCALLFCLFLFAWWTVAHQLSTFVGISWNTLVRATEWACAPVMLLSFVASEALARTYTGQLARPASSTPAPLPPPAWIAALAAFGMLMFVQNYTLRFTLLMAGLAIALFASRKPPLGPATVPRLEASAATGSATLRDSLCLLLLMAAAVVVVLCANRSDFDDAEYIQSAIQTIRYPERAVFTFDASLGTVLESFRFAPYRLTSYETSVGLIAQSTGMDILDVYYLFVPGVTAALSVLTAFVFLRWFLPLRWALLAVAVFLLIALAWGESHVAFGNRMYVRLFQGKGLLIAITSPMAIVMALLWMRKPGILAWLGLLAIQIVAVGASSSGLVVTLFSTFIGLLSGFMVQRSRLAALNAATGGLVLAYPTALGLWLKYASSASGKVEEIGTYLPIDASFGSSARELVTMLILGLACAALSRRLPRTSRHDPPPASISDSTAFWLIACSFLLALNPFLIAAITQATSKNMNWRLAWAAPVPLLLALGMVTLSRSSLGAVRLRGVSILAPMVICGAFFVAGPWTLTPGNNVTWGWAERKLPAEYHQALGLAADIRRLTKQRATPTVLVDPRIGTWLTVVAPEFRLVMPGHGYVVTLQTIMEPKDFEQRVKLLGGIGAIMAGDKAFDPLLDLYGVDIVVAPGAPEKAPASFHIRQRAVPSVAVLRPPGGADSGEHNPC